MKTVLCRCLNEMSVPDDHAGSALCECCAEGSREQIAEALRRAMEAKKQRQRQEAELFYMRAAAVVPVHARKYGPGDEVAARCPGCRKPYVYDERMMLVHQGACAGGARQDEKAAAAPAPVVARVRRASMWYDDDEEDDDG